MSEICEYNIMHENPVGSFLVIPCQAMSAVCRAHSLECAEHLDRADNNRKNFLGITCTFSCRNKNFVVFNLHNYHILWYAVECG